MKYILQVPTVVAGISIVLMMLHVTADALGRYTLHMPLPATMEVASLYYMVPLGVLPLAELMRRDELISVDLVANLLPEKGRRILNGVGYLVVAAVAGACTYWTALEASSQTESGEVWESVWGLVLAWPARWFMPIGLGLLAIMALVKLVLLVRPAHDRH